LVDWWMWNAGHLPSARNSTITRYHGEMVLVGAGKVNDIFGILDQDQVEFPTAISSISRVCWPATGAIRRIRVKKLKKGDARAVCPHNYRAQQHCLLRLDLEISWIGLCSRA
jgi:hypothetical protein